MKIKHIAFGLLMLPLSAYSASFDCEKASTLIENAICNDTELSTLDDSLLFTYKQALAKAGNSENIKQDQKNWLKNTRNKCKNVDCLKKVYQERIELLNDVSNFSSSISQQSVNDLPTKIGKCADSFVAEKTTRFEDAVPGEAGGEVNIGFANGLGVYITEVPYLSNDANPDKHLYHSQDFVKGDKVKICLISVPQECPPGDERGKAYSVTNYKNKKTFSGVDSWHSCGGA